MNAVQRNLNVLIEQKGLNQTGFARAIGKTPGAVSQWLNDKGKPPSMKAVLQICDAFGLQPSDILSEQDGLYARAMRGSKLYPREANIPTASNGYAHHAKADGSILVYAPPNVIERHRSSYFITCADDGMSKVFPAGCDILIDPEMEPETGSVVVAQINGERVPRRYYKGSSIVVLSPDSWDSSYSDVVTEKADIEGVIVWFQSSGEL